MNYRTLRVDNILDTVGKTPIVKLNKINQGLKPEIYLKLELFNPGGSVKDRIAMAMVNDAEKKGLLKPGGTIIEATAGNTGLGLALVSAVKGYRCICVMPDKMSADKIRLLRAYGAEVIITPTNVPPDSPQSYNGVADRLAKEIPGAWRPNQFTNLANPEMHYLTTGPEIWEQTDGRITAFVAGAGTGGTISGVGKYLKEKNPNIRVIGADIEGSVLSGDSPKSWKVEGIGEDFVPHTLNAQVVDEWIRVSDAESFSTVRRLAREEGILLGGSSGTAIYAGLKYAQRCNENELIVIMCPDTGRNYLSKVYDDKWMYENGFIETPPEQTKVIQVLDILGRTKKVITIKPDNTLEEVITLFEQHAISQAPVVEQENIIGAVEEITVMHALHRGAQPSIKVRDIMARPLPSVSPDTFVEEAYRILLSGASAIVIVENKEILGILSRSDLIKFYELRTKIG
ncbi:MAG: cystathionine beta-synthase [Candidatus Hydrogenedentes bacterium]|nr:cystathionine beta-synthase [Candidatus Hydrogenedentota bacterium]